MTTQQGNVVTLLPEMFVVVQCPPGGEPPSIISQRDIFKMSTFFSVSITPEEVSIIGPENVLTDLISESTPKTAAGEGTSIVAVDRNWRCFKVEGPLDFSLVGILYGILGPLKSANISALAIGTYNTDYFLVKQNRTEEAVAALKVAGFQVNNPPSQQESHSTHLLKYSQV